MQFPKQYPFAIAAAVGISLQAWSQGMYIGKLRKEIFNQDFMRKEFGERHRRQLNQEISVGGYPDTGSGLYSRNLSYRDWYRFNVAQRIHMNYVQNIAFAQSTILAAGIYKPKHAAVLGIIYILARFAYGYFYKQKKGALNKGRIAGVAISMLAIAINIGIFVTNFYKNHCK